MRSFTLAISTLTSLLFFCIKDTVSQPYWNQINSGIESNLNSIASYWYSGNTFVIVGDSGVILQSTDGGLSWRRISSPTYEKLYFADFRSDSVVFACGSNGTLLKSSDQGNNWQMLSSVTSHDLKYVNAWISPLSIYVAGENGFYAKITNNIWTTQIIDTADINTLLINPQGERIYAGGDYGTLLYTSNSGSVWTRLQTYSKANINASYSSNLLVGDCGTSWRVNSNMAYPNTLNTKKNLYCMDEPSLSFDQYLCGEDGLFMVNGRITQTNTALDLKSFRISYDNKAIAVGEAGTILHTADVTESPYEKNLNGNNIRAWFMNNGRFNNHSQSNGGFEWPKGSNKYAKFSSGLILGGLVGSDTLLAVCDYDSEFFPGQTVGGIPQGNGTPDFKIFKIIHGASDSDRADWPNIALGNSNQGAPVFFDSSTGTVKPNDFGNQTMFYSYTDSYSESHRHYAGRTKPLMCDVKQITYCFNQPEELKNVIYQEYRITNRSNTLWNEFYITFFSDDDLGDAQDDAEATDTSMRLSYTYNFDNYDEDYGTNPPATGFSVVRAPYIRTGSAGDTVKYYEGRLSRFRTGIKESKFSANIIFHDDTWQPGTKKDLFNTMKGLMKTGSPYINPVNGQPTKFMYSGDPATNTGWIQNSTGDMRFYLSFGPMSVNPGDTQIVVIAQVIAQGSDRLRSITELRETAVQARDFYDNMFRGVVINAVSNSTELPATHKLYQNFPNPFNPATEIRFELSKPADVELTVFDISGRKVKTLENRRFDAGGHIVRFDAGDLSSGIYILQFNADETSESMKMLYLK